MPIEAGNEPEALLEEIEGLADRLARWCSAIWKA